MSTNIAVAKPKLYGPRSKVFVERLLREHLPVIGGIELTHRCNLACVHCYVNLAPNDREAQRREMTTDEVKRVLDELAAAGTLWLTLTGGEPLLRPDFAEIYSHAFDKGFLVTVYSNATLITDRIIDLWLERPPRTVEITQYGFSRATYDHVTDAGEQYDRFQRGLQRARAAGITITLKTIAMRDNVHEVHQIRRFAQDHGMRFRFDAVISPRIDGGRKPLLQRLTPAEVAAVESGDEVSHAAEIDYCRSHEGWTAKDNRRYQCGAGLSSFVIDPYGKLHVCELSRRPGWDVLKHGFREGFDKEFPRLRAETREHMDGCGTCPTITSCSNCTGMAELEGLSPDGGNPYMCQMTDARNALIFGDTRVSPNGLVQLRRRASNG
jgi:radical SAM protein with 4Fe4S-binding SPASM domain